MAAARSDAGDYVEVEWGGRYLPISAVKAKIAEKFAALAADKERLDRAWKARQTFNGGKQTSLRVAAAAGPVAKSTLADYEARGGANGGQGECLRGLSVSCEGELALLLAIRQTVRRPATKQEVLELAAKLSALEQARAKAAHKPLIAVGFVNDLPSDSWWRRFMTTWEDTVRRPP